ncbi:uncharacterized protein APUU_80069A [Aspergillus puulaauensis]|uniref:Uncharacterized protein n=1 Tax=Aspergillus puulaauensis TaxID=1220207 RepID=A0A7R7XY17_9EURO|nr:uncharacterized protein APUU_80069A [Aspergillus puulaauensis]BCS29766.1 hypothetical protein APUU_80069A [Aspergillus puulaauensis]
MPFYAQLTRVSTADKSPDGTGRTLITAMNESVLQRWFEIASGKGVKIWKHEKDWFTCAASVSDGWLDWIANQNDDTRGKILFTGLADRQGESGIWVTFHNPEA